MTNKKIYIGTLYVGENELEECKKSVQEQTHKNIKHEIFSFLPNKEAHETIYGKFMELRNEYDYFIKLDADMVLNRNTLLEELINYFEKNRNLDQAVFSLNDWYSNTIIMGMHMYSNRVSWGKINGSLFVDPNPNIPGERKIEWNNPSPVADHSPNPSIIEAYMFGYHRALKIVQRDRFHKITDSAKFQLNLLQHAWKALLNNKNYTRLAVIYGANEVFNSKAISLDKKSLDDEQTINNIKNINIDNFINVNKKYWDSETTFYKLRYFRYCKLSDIIYYFEPNNRIKNIIKNIIRYK